MKSNYEKIKLSKSLFGILMELDSCCDLHRRLGGDSHIKNEFDARISKEDLKEKIIRLAQNTK